MWRIGLLAAVSLLLGTTVMAMEAYVVGGRTLVPLRMVGESFGASVQYDSRTKGVSLSLDYQKVNMTVDSPRAHVGNRVVVLDAPAVVVGGVCYVPARFVSDSFGFNIAWSSGQVVVVHPKTKKQVVMVVSRHVPPGLAKKGGVPPGLARRHRGGGPWHDAGDDHGQGKGHEKGHGKGHGMK